MAKDINNYILYISELSDDLAYSKLVELKNVIESENYKFDIVQDNVKRAKKFDLDYEHFINKINIRLSEISINDYISNL